MASPTLRRTIGNIGLFVALVTAISIPLLYALLSHWNTTEALSFQARLNSGYVAKYVYQNGSMWPFHKVRLAEVVELNKAKATDAKHRIYSADGTLVLEEGPALATPTMVRSDAIVVRGREVGRVEVETSLRPLLLNTGLAALFSAALGLLAYYPFRVLPVKLLDRTVGALEAKSEAALSNMSQGLCMYDAENRLVVGNRRFLEIYRLPEQAIAPGTHFSRVLETSKDAGNYPDRTAQEVYAEREVVIAEGQPAVFHQSLSGGRTVAISHVPMTSGGWIVTYDDITERERMSRALEEKRTQMDAALTNMAHGLCMFDAEKRLVLCNARYASLYDLPSHLTRPGTPLADILAFRAALGSAPVDADTYLGQHASLAARRDTTVFDCKLQDGRVVRISHKPMANGGYVASHEDITAVSLAEAQIAHMAHHDALTGLPNRVLFREEMDRALTRVRRGDKLAVLCLDLDHFKAVNDTLGHPVGDALLRAVGERLRDCVRDTDTIARLGGDEFAVVQVGADQPHHATVLAERIIEKLSAPYDLDGHQVVVGTSVGIAISPDDSDTPDNLLKAADMALYRAKSDGRGIFRYFEAEMDAKMQLRRALELDLRKALQNGEFEVHYQPLINLAENRVSGFEGLLRWTHPERGRVSPADFIPLAEEIGLINQIGAWVLKRACADAATWPDEVRLAVNLSPTQFKSRTLVLDVISALASSGLRAQRLELEITETVMLQDTEITLATLHQLKDLGVRISMDDFGTGYSSLSYLRKFPFDKIKIDQSFIRDLPHGNDAVAIIRAVAGLGTSLGMSTTAEGVETEGQLAKLRAEGCTEVQGWLFSPARPASEVAGLLSSVAEQCRAAA